MEDRVCPGCRESNPAHARMCGMCRTTLVTDEAIDDGGRLVTVVTSDLKGSTALGERLDPESLREVLNRYFAVMRVVFESHGGSIEKIIGDAIVAVFGLPFRHADDPIRAIEAAAETQRALVILNDELERLFDVRLVNRTGVATGVVHFGRDAEGQHVLIGEAMDESTAMEQNAPPLEILLADSAYREVRDFVDAEGMGPMSPKGSDVRIESHRLISVVGRAAEGEVDVPEPSPGMRICQVCGGESHEHSRYCVTCGATATTAVSRESRKTVTIVFANPKPHTAGDEPLDPRAFTDVMTRYFEVMKVALERHGGTVEKFIGDAVMAVFGLPVRHEDDALRAVRAAADMQAALPALNDALDADHGVRLLNHIGVNTGEVIAAGDASTGQRLVTGDTVNTAARLEQAAGPAEIILGELTHRLSRDEIEVEVIPPLTLKGKAEPVSAYRVVRVRDRPAERAALATRFVGREIEMARLSEGLFLAAGHKRAHLITIVGDAGVGKSRLIREFAGTASHEAGLVRGRCLPYGDGITFWPLAEVVRDAAGIGAADSPEAAIAKVQGLLIDPDDAIERDAVTDRVASMMGLSATQYPVSELMWGMRRLLEMMASRRPLVVIIDDIQSAEPTFLEFLDYLVETAEGASILVVCSARHEVVERHEAWAEAHAASTLTLVPLTDGETGQLVGELLGDLAPSVRERITTSAEGNPLYAEQIVSMLQETGAIRREGDRWVATRASDELAIPPTVQALVAARLDALGAEERAVIEPASVIGLSFAEEAITELIEEETRTRLEVDLGSLAAKQLIRRTSSEDGFYRFGHLVIRDTAYGSLLKRIRADLHERFVDWAERINRERGRETEFEEILGYHLEQAYRYRAGLAVVDDEVIRLGIRASEKLASAGRRALGRGDLPAAVGLLQRAVATRAIDDHDRWALAPDLGIAHVETGEFGEAMDVLRDAVERADRAGDRLVAARARMVICFVELYSGDSPDWSESTTRQIDLALPLFEREGDEVGQTLAWRLRSGLLGSAGRWADVTEASAKVIEHAAAAGDTRAVTRAALTYSVASVYGPSPVDEAIRELEQLLDRSVTDQYVVVSIRVQLSILYAMRGDFAHSRELYADARVTLHDLRAKIAAAATSIGSSRVEMLAGDLQAAEAELRVDYETLTGMGEKYVSSTVGGLLARVLFAQGRIAAAEALASSLRADAPAGDSDAQALWRLAMARILALRSETDEAIVLVAEAVSLRRETDAPSDLAEALDDQAEILVAAGRSSEAVASWSEGLALVRRKGDTVTAARIQARLASLSGAGHEPAGAAP